MYFSEFRHQTQLADTGTIPLTVESLSKEVTRLATKRVVDKMAGDTLKKAKQKRRLNQDVLPQMTREEETRIPQCPPGYRFDKKQLMCVPKTPQDSVSGRNNKDNHPGNGPSFNVIGSHGMNGAPYAYEEPATSNGAEAVPYTEGVASRRAKRKVRRACAVCGAKKRCGCPTFTNFQDLNSNDESDGGDGGGDGGGGMGESMGYGSGVRNFNRNAAAIARKQSNRVSRLDKNGQLKPRPTHPSQDGNKSPLTPVKPNKTLRPRPIRPTN